LAFALVYAGAFEAEGDQTGQDVTHHGQFEGSLHDLASFACPGSGGQGAPHSGSGGGPWDEERPEALQRQTESTRDSMSPPLTGRDPSRKQSSSHSTVVSR